jgi:hypothetical protein
LCADLIGALGDIEYPSTFKNKEQLTMFADYRVPQILRQLEIMEYTPELATKIDNEEELPYSSPEEVEIRASTVIAVEMIMEKIRGDPEINKHVTCCYEVDWLLW